MNDLTCPPNCCDETDDVRADDDLLSCDHPDWTRYLRCVECGEPMTFENCGPFGGVA